MEGENSINSIGPIAFVLLLLRKAEGRLSVVKPVDVMRVKKLGLVDLWKDKIRLRVG